MTISVQQPKAAYQALQANSSAILIDVRDTLEYNFIGHPLDAVNIPWRLWHNGGWAANSAFLTQVSELLPDKATPIFLLCRSGQRSLDAAKALAEIGYTQLTNIDEGFEGGLDEHKHRSSSGGWRYHGLPWVQT